MEKAQINFKQERDFGEIFSATFAFIGQEFKRLGSAILFFVLPVLLIASILIVMLGIDQQQMMQEISGGDPTAIGDPFSMMGSIFSYMGLIMVIYAVAFTMLKCTVYGYVKIYNEKGKDGFGLGDIWNQVMRYFFPVLGISILINIIVVLGFMFCVIPGIYLGVSLSLIYLAFLLEGKGFGNAFSRSFELTGQKWWLTLGLIIVAYLMIYMMSFIISVPALIAGIKPMITSMRNLEEPDFGFTTWYYVWNSVIYLVMYTLFTIPYIILAFHYFSLVEAKDKPSLLEQIDEIESDSSNE
jgi:hypothetical protein